MSLQDLTPRLDDRDYARIVGEARALIPRYTPEWTDQNDSDSGMALVQLFAWMTETTLYRLNQVPELNYLKFLELLGIELREPRPARAELTFSLTRPDLEGVFIPKGAQVAAAPPEGESAPVIFETDEGIFALGATLREIQSLDAQSYSLETKKNEFDGQWFYPFGAHPREGSALLLGFDSPVAFTSQTLNLACYLAEEERRVTTVHCELDLSNMPVAATLAWEFWDGQFWQPLSLEKDETRSFTRSGHIFVRGPGARAKKAKIGEAPDPLYWLRCRVERSDYEIAPRLDSILTNTVAATQAATVKNEVLGGSDGRPNQSFRLPNSPIIRPLQSSPAPGPDGAQVQVWGLRLEIAETADEFVAWQEVEDFAASERRDPHFTLNYNTGEIQFGDGVHGRIPAANNLNPAGNIVARAYRYGGGKAGNLPPGSIINIQTFIAGIDKATNWRPSAGGVAEETLSDAKLRAKQTLKSQDRAVTAEDFEALAEATPGVNVRRAKALPLIHPKFIGAPIPGVVTVIIVPESDAARPLPSEPTLQTVCAHLNQHRLLTTEVFVIAPTYAHVKIQADLIVKPDADLGVVKREVETRLSEYFHPLRGGEDRDGWDFGGPIFYSRVYRVVMETPGVDRIDNNQLDIFLNGQRTDFCRDVNIEEGALLYTTEHAIQVSYSRRT